jgi:hypothetical protein
MARGVGAATSEVEGAKGSTTCTTTKGLAERAIPFVLDCKGSVLWSRSKGPLLLDDNGSERALREGRCRREERCQEEESRSS